MNEIVESPLERLLSSRECVLTEGNVYSLLPPGVGRLRAVIMGIKLSAEKIFETVELDRFLILENPERAYELAVKNISKDYEMRSIMPDPLTELAFGLGGIFTNPAFYGAARILENALQGGINKLNQLDLDEVIFQIISNSCRKGFFSAGLSLASGGKIIPIYPCADLEADSDIWLEGRSYSFGKNRLWKNELTLLHWNAFEKFLQEFSFQVGIRSFHTGLENISEELASKGFVERHPFGILKVSEMGEDRYYAYKWLNSGRQYVITDRTSGEQFLFPTARIATLVRVSSGRLLDPLPTFYVVERYSHPFVKDFGSGFQMACIDGSFVSSELSRCSSVPAKYSAALNIAEKTMIHGYEAGTSALHPYHLLDVSNFKSERQAYLASTG